MINGGLGLLLQNGEYSNANNAEYIAYGVITSLIWLVWTSLWVFYEYWQVEQKRLVEKGTEIPSTCSSTLDLGEKIYTAQVVDCSQRRYTIYHSGYGESDVDRQTYSNS